MLLHRLTIDLIKISQYTCIRNDEAMSHSSFYPEKKPIGERLLERDMRNHF